MAQKQEQLNTRHAQLGLAGKGRAIKDLVVCNSLDLESLDLLNGLALGCYQPSPDVSLQRICIAPKFKNNHNN